MNEKTKDAWVAYTNTDCTEGRGFDIPIAICECEATAVRLARRQYVQGSDGPVRKVELTLSGGYWTGPVVVVPPSREDIAAQSALDAKKAATDKARAAGLSDDDMRALGWKP